MARVRNLKVGKDIVEKPYYKDADGVVHALKRWIHNGVVVWEDGVELPDGFIFIGYLSTSSSASASHFYIYNFATGKFHWVGGYGNYELRFVHANQPAVIRFMNGGTRAYGYTAKQEEVAADLGTVFYRNAMNSIYYGFSPVLDYLLDYNNKYLYSINRANDTQAQLIGNVSIETVSEANKLLFDEFMENNVTDFLCYANYVVALDTENMNGYEIRDWSAIYPGAVVLDIGSETAYSQSFSNVDGYNGDIYVLWSIDIYNRYGTRRDYEFKMIALHIHRDTKEIGYTQLYRISNPEAGIGTAFMCTPYSICCDSDNDAVYALFSIGQLGFTDFYYEYFRSDNQGESFRKIPLPSQLRVRNADDNSIITIGIPTELIQNPDGDLQLSDFQYDNTYAALMLDNKFFGRPHGMFLRTKRTYSGNRYYYLYLDNFGFTSSERNIFFSSYAAKYEVF